MYAIFYNYIKKRKKTYWNWEDARGPGRALKPRFKCTAWAPGCCDPAFHHSYLTRSPRTEENYLEALLAFTPTAGQAIPADTEQKTSQTELRCSHDGIY